MAIDNGLIQAGGAGSFTLPDGTKMRGRENVREYLLENPKLTKELLEQIK
jgi:hypothetical protein